MPGGLQIGRLSPEGRLALISPQMKARVDELGGIKGLASGPDGSLYATCPGAVLKVKLDGTFTVFKHPIAVPDCNRYLPANTPAAYEPLANISHSRNYSEISSEFLISCHIGSQPTDSSLVSTLVFSLFHLAGLPSSRLWD